MRFLVYLMSLLFVGTAIAQNPTILQGSYVSNVFGQSNFVLNPNAQTNVANVTNATRSTTTPLVATSEFTLNLTSGTFATWTLRAFDSGMKGQNCEARFSYRGFATATSTAQIVQNSLVVAQLVLTPSTDPRIASINFPCGDLANATTFRIAQTTANMTGTNEIGGIYTGLATNQANVAQAEAVLNVFRNTALSVPTTTDTTVLWNDIGLDALGEYTAATGIYKAKRAGQYLVSAQILYDFASWSTAGTNNDIYIFKNGAQTSSNVNYTQAAVTTYIGIQVTATVSLAVGDEVKIIVRQGSGTTKNLVNLGLYNHLKIYRFPTSSELVVTPERQNTWGGVVYDDSTQNQFFGTAEPTAFTSYNNATWNKPTKLKGKASVTTTNSGNDLGFSVDQLPVGNYKVTLTNGFYTAPGLTDQDAAICVFRVRETTTNTIIGRIQLQAVRLPASNVTQDGFGVIDGVFTQTSLGQRNFILEASKTFDSNASNFGQCVTIANSSAPNILSFTITPLDQPSNSALYVEGPVKASATGAAIPEGYVNEFSTRSISDTSLRQQSSPTVGTFYYPWTSTLTLPAGNWLLCYKALIEQEQTVSSSAVAFPRMHIQNQTDSSIVMTQAALGQVTSAPFNINYIWSPVSQCKPIAITSSKTFRMGIAYGNNTGTASVLTLRLRGDISETELYAVRLN